MLFRLVGKVAVFVLPALRRSASTVLHLRKQALYHRFMRTSPILPQLAFPLRFFAGTLGFFSKISCALAHLEELAHMAYFPGAQFLLRAHSFWPVLQE